MIGGISVSVTTGLGSAIVTTASGDNQVSICFSPIGGVHIRLQISPQFKYWFIYFLMVFVAVTLGMEQLFGTLC